MSIQLRIAWLINLYPPYVVGGNEMLARDVVEALRARGHEVHVLTAHGEQFAELPGVHQVLNYDLVHEKDALFRGARRLTWLEQLRHYIFDRTTYRNVRRTVKVLQPDLVVVDNLYQASAAPLLALHDVECPVVAQVADKWLIYLLRDLDLLLHPTWGPARFLVRAYVKIVQPFFWRWARPDALITISSFIKEFYARYGFPEACMTPLHLGVDTSLYQTRDLLQQKTAGLEVAFAGQLWEGKGPQVLVEALGRLRQEHPELDLRLRIIGTGNAGFLSYLQDEVSRWNLTDRTIFEGFLSLPDLAQRLRETDIFVFPSIWDEPFSITLPAAMASGLPVIATSSGGTPESFEDGIEGLLVPPNDAEALAAAILRLARDPVERQRLAQAAAQRARRNWSFTAYVDRLESHYLKLTGKEA